MKYDGEPLVDVVVNGKSCEIVCPWCGKTHAHGRPQKQDTPEHRLSHCTTGKGRSYYIIERAGLMYQTHQPCGGLSGD